MPTSRASQSTTSLLLAGFVLSLTACTGKTPEGKISPLEQPYADALCECWQLFDFGDLYFESEQQCRDAGPSIGAGLIPWDAACALPIYEQNISASQEACVAEGMQRAIDCLGTLPSCGDDQYEAYGTCVFETSGIADCGRASDAVLDKISEACTP